MRGLFSRLQDALGTRTASSSKDEAKQRLKFLLIHDQVDLTPAQLDKMKEEILGVIAKYCEVEADAIEFELDREDGQVALVSSIPIRRVTAARA